MEFLELKSEFRNVLYIFLLNKQSFFAKLLPIHLQYY